MDKMKEPILEEGITIKMTFCFHQVIIMRNPFKPDITTTTLSLCSHQLIYLFFVFVLFFLCAFLQRSDTFHISCSDLIHW